MKLQARIKKLINSKTKKETVRPKVIKSRKLTVVKKPVHQHVWKVIGKTYAPPVNFASITIQIAEKPLEKAMFGVTTLLWECQCGETKKEELLGSDEDLLESIINKADKIGPQFIERVGKTFIISEWRTPTQNPNMVPLK